MDIVLGVVSKSRDVRDLCDRINIERTRKGKKPLTIWAAYKIARHPQLRERMGDPMSKAKADLSEVNARRAERGERPLTMPEFHRRRAAAMQAFEERMPFEERMRRLEQ